jgi:hypothetical protein
LTVCAAAEVAALAAFVLTPAAAAAVVLVLDTNPPAAVEAEPNSAGVNVEFPSLLSEKSPT